MAWSDASYNWHAGPSSGYYSDVQADDSRKCQVIGCHKKHGFVRVERGKKIYSKYCGHHTCDYPYPEDKGGFCFTARKTGDRYCPLHQQCGKSGCDKRGEYLGTDNFILWYCPEHRCTESTCTSGATNPHQQRCTTHFVKCTTPSCSRPAHLHRSGTLDAHCAVHYNTRPCLSPSCTRPTSSSRSYCPHHACPIPSCPAPRAGPDTSACVRHLCARPRCPDPVLDPDHPASAHCAGHTCRALPCVQPRAEGADFCRTHGCAAPGCRAPGRAGSSGSGRAGYCEARHACVVRGCGEPRLSGVASSRLDVGGSSMRERCARHARELMDGVAASGRRRAVSLDDGESVPWSYEGRTAKGERRWSGNMEGVRREEVREGIWEGENTFGRYYVD